jgi:ADP-heptose:LPS heptosyltransferase
MNKIAIIRRNGLGDLLCAFPLVLHLQKLYPAAHITLFVDQRNVPLIPYLPPVVEVVVFPAKGNKYFNTWRTALRYRGKFDIAYSAKTSPMKLMNFFLHWLNATERVAYVDGKWHSRYVNRSIPYDPEEMKGEHQALKTLKMVSPDLTEVSEDLFPSLLVSGNIKPFSFPFPVVLASASTTRSASRLDPIKYARLLNRLHEDAPIAVVVIGQIQDRIRAEEIASHLKGPHLVHFPRNFDEFMLFLKAADSYFIGDGGIAHIGAALGKPSVVLYGETNPAEWRPLSKKALTFFHPEHVDYLNDEAIYQALKRIRTCGRDN